MSLSRVAQLVHVALFARRLFRRVQRSCSRGKLPWKARPLRGVRHRGARDGELLRAAASQEHPVERSPSTLPTLPEAAA